MYGEMNGYYTPMAIDVPILFFREFATLCDVQTSLTIKQSAKITYDVVEEEILLDKYLCMIEGVSGDHFWEHVVGNEHIFDYVWNKCGKSHYYLLFRLVEYWTVESIPHLMEKYKYLHEDFTKKFIVEGEIRETMYSALLAHAYSCAIRRNNTSVAVWLYRNYPVLCLAEGWYCVSSQEMLDFVCDTLSDIVTKNNCKYTLPNGVVYSRTYNTLNDMCRIIKFLCDNNNIILIDYGVEKKYFNTEILLRALNHCVWTGNLYMIKYLVQKYPRAYDNISEWKHYGTDTTIGDESARSLETLTLIHLLFPHIKLTYHAYNVAHSDFHNKERNYIILYLQSNFQDIKFPTVFRYNSDSTPATIDYLKRHFMLSSLP